MSEPKRTEPRNGGLLKAKRVGKGEYETPYHKGANLAETFAIERARLAALAESEVAMKHPRVALLVNRRVAK